MKAILKNDSSAFNIVTGLWIDATLVNEPIEVLSNLDYKTTFVFLPQENEVENPYGRDIHTTHSQNVYQE
jgi:hypothetical protein